MEKFDAISVRDSFTENFVNSIINKSGELVLDPTFLIDITADIDSLNLKSPYILFYYCDGMPDEMKKQIIYQAHKNGYSVYGAGECNKLYDDITVNLTPFQWVGMFKNASYVLQVPFMEQSFLLKTENSSVFMPQMRVEFAKFRICWISWKYEGEKQMALKILKLKSRLNITVFTA